VAQAGGLIGRRVWLDQESAWQVGKALQPEVDGFCPTHLVAAYAVNQIVN
jgi:hypothetical protein